MLMLALEKCVCAELVEFGTITSLEAIARGVAASNALAVETQLGSSDIQDPRLTSMACKSDAALENV